MIMRAQRTTRWTTTTTTMTTNAVRVSECSPSMFVDAAFTDVSSRATGNPAEGFAQGCGRFVNGIDWDGVPIMFRLEWAAR